ncbi:pyridoxal phosphate-dependent transferase [Mrakia frigida]|uniref:pyridoxal phosphate-dependent aminotransferase n=1 Tax=Mrakia frigida TaxID=29902 RepID=UPI003FCC0515
MTQVSTSGTVLSNRAQKHFAGMPVSRHNPPPGGFYDEFRHPEGVINLTTAENGLMKDELLEFINNPTSPLFTSQHLKYRNTLLASSVPHLDDLLVKYANDWYDPTSPVTRETSVTGPGLGALLASLCWALLEVGEGVLLSTVFYSDYIRDITYPALGKLVLADIPPEVDSLSPAVLPYLRARILSSAKEGINVRCLVLCNPHNPLPRCYEEETILGYLALAEEFSLQLIVDEAYALSVYPSPGHSSAPFKSILSLLPAPRPHNVHLLLSPSKDLGLSAFKVGLLVSGDEGVVKFVKKAMFSTPISGASDAVVSRILGDHAFLKEMREGNWVKLREAFELVKGWCDFHRLEYEEASATVYTVINFTPFLNSLAKTTSSTSSIPPNEDPEIIDLAVQKMLDEGTFLKPTGETMADPIKGRFRMIFTQKPKTMKMALRRIEKAFGLEEAPFFD